ncbi:hypothetical protein GCM10027429_17750 [Marivirga atlantica]|uniref:AraC family transcriptional regulator n=1 Tax=Marivirga atlantica TaxID=1548457 RepID=A0A937AET5_9BACT|nr:helix-turn-helix domain-containing protein [Marivirga atlantica]MBL0765391.1 AraC family transcriptional regulator [Marivirga atlantica]
MILIEDQPKDPVVTKYVDRYQLFIINEPAYFKTIPNGKIECYFVEEGEFLRWDNEANSFVTSGLSGYLPATNHASLIQIPTKLICLNVKLNLSILSLSSFDDFLKKWQKFPVSALVSTREEGKLGSCIDLEKPKINVSILDKVLASSLSKMRINKEAEKVVNLIESSISEKLNVSELANQANCSGKTFERMIRKQFNMSPKDLLQVLRFENVSSDMKNKSDRRFVDSLAFGYYDQSHFIKECRKFTGYPPKEFFSKLKLKTNDIIVGND